MLYCVIYISHITTLKAMKTPFPPDYFPNMTFTGIILNIVSLYCWDWFCPWSVKFSTGVSLEELSSSESDSVLSWLWVLMFLSSPFINRLFTMTVVKFSVGVLWLKWHYWDWDYGYCCWLNPLYLGSLIFDIGWTV